MRADFIVKELDDIVLINAISRETIKENEVYTFALRLCDNDIDRDFERFGDSTLEELSPMFVGKAGIFDHRWSAKGRVAHIYRTEVVDDGGAITSDGRPRRFLKGWAYMMRTPENAAIIDKIKRGIKREVSVGCAVEQVLCSICGRPIDECQHKKGTEYNGKMCCGLLVGAKDAYEWAFVTNPTVADVLIPVDSEMLKWLDMKQFPEDSQELVDAIREAVYLAYKRA